MQDVCEIGVEHLLTAKYLLQRHVQTFLDSFLADANPLYSAFATLVGDSCPSVLQ